MNRTVKVSMLAAAAVQSLGVPAAQAQQGPMSFFITSVGSGKGGDLGGLAGADAHCQSLAQAAGAGTRTWRAYLSNFAAARGHADQRPRPHRQRAVAQRQG